MDVNAKEKPYLVPSISEERLLNSGEPHLERLTYNLRKLAVLDDMSQMPNYEATIRELAKRQGEKEDTIRASVGKYLKFGYIKISGRLPSSGRGRCRRIYKLTEKGERVLAKMKDLIARSLPPAPQKYRLEEWG